MKRVMNHRSNGRPLPTKELFTTPISIATDPQSVRVPIASELVAVSVEGSFLWLWWEAPNERSAMSGTEVFEIFDGGNKHLIPAMASHLKSFNALGDSGALKTWHLYCYPSGSWVEDVVEVKAVESSDGE